MHHKCIISLSSVVEVGCLPSELFSWSLQSAGTWLGLDDLYGLQKLHLIVACWSELSAFKFHGLYCPGFSPGWKAQGAFKLQLVGAQFSITWLTKSWAKPGVQYCEGAQVWQRQDGDHMKASISILWPEDLSLGAGGVIRWKHSGRTEQSKGWFEMIRITMMDLY